MKASFTAAHLEDTVVEKGRTDLREYLDALRSVRESRAYDAPESSINLPSDDERIDRALSLAQETGASAKTVLVIGIGGSNLGTEALYQALRSVREVKEMLFIETVDEELLRAPQSVFARSERLE